MAATSDESEVETDVDNLSPATANFHTVVCSSEAVRSVTIESKDSGVLSDFDIVDAFSSPSLERLHIAGNKLQRSRSLTSIIGSSFSVPGPTVIVDEFSPPLERSHIAGNKLQRSRSLPSIIGSSFSVPGPTVIVDEFSPLLERSHIAGNKPDLAEMEVAAAFLNIEETTRLSINRSPHFTVAEKIGVPFLHHKVLECDHHSQEYTIQNHDVTFRIPEGAVPTGKTIQFEIAVAMYGPFKFEKDTQPISPIIWLCFDEGVTLNKPFHVILPHFLTGLTYKKAQYHHMIFAKAPHSKYSIEDGQMKYSFQPCDSEPYFASCEGRNFGVLVTNHTCFYCLQAKKTPELAMEAGYCLARIDCFNQQHNIMEVTFTAVYYLRTCLNAIKEQFPYEEGYRINYKNFKFKKKTKPHVRVVPTYECDKLIVALDPTSAKIRAGDIDFWKKDLDTMKLQHEEKMYPPRVKMTVGMKNPDDHNRYILSVKIEGCSKEDQLDIQLFFLPCTLPCVSSSVYTASSSMSQGECQSPKIKVQEQPELKDVFRELLPLSANWKNIGTLLGLSKGLIERIAKDEDGARDQLREMLSGWLNQVDPRPTWASLADAVEPVDKVYFERYNVRIERDSIHELLDWTPYDAEVEKFKREHIYQSIINSEISEMSMSQWLGSLQIHEFNQTAMRLKEQQQQKQLQQSTPSSSSSTSMATVATGDTTQPEGEGSSVADNTAAESDDIEQGVNVTTDKVSHQQIGSAAQESGVDDIAGPFPAVDDDVPSDCHEPSVAVQSSESSLEESKPSDAIIIKQTNEPDKNDIME